MPEVMINGPEGRLEGRYHHSKEENAPIALILHPHPQHGGNMNNKIVYTMFQTFRQLGFCVLRINFRGVGRSQGSFDEGLGELSDAASVLDWMQTHNPNARSCWIAGFSFGAWIGMQVLMRRPEIQGFISISPPANKYDFAFLAPCPSSGLIIQGDKDDIVPEHDTAGLVKKLQQQKHITIDYQIIKSADHFFEGHLETIAKSVGIYVSNAMNSQNEQP
tara:strand:+ start:107855 stop:108511 length:657 start_codon:yes stop_codon:yes gene_type:complete